MRWTSAHWLRSCWISFAVSLWRDNFKSWLCWRLIICRDIKTFLLNYSIIRHVSLMRAWVRYYFLEIAQVIATWRRTLNWSLLQSCFWATRRYYLLDLLCRWTLDHWYLITASPCWEILFARSYNWCCLLCFIGLRGNGLTCWDEARCCWVSRIDIVVVRNCIDILSIWHLLLASPRNVLVWCWSDAKIINIGVNHQLYCGYLAALKILLLLFHSFCKGLSFPFVLLVLLRTEYKIGRLWTLRLWVLSLREHIFLRWFSLL